ncbi:UDP-glucose/GDP-mannose dehydrogenase family protein [Nocardioides bigeumensis]|uniref:UDP-glucose 6-dehydrogenase n=1 Tax=Nocardioides bigeumensis TaxID=433657 RepID=A0ABN2YYK9_9ACTN
MRISVIGCGYLGATHAACMAELGFEVVGVEIDPVKRAGLAAGKVPFFEPGLQDLLAEHVASGRLRFTDSAQEAAEFADVHFVCVGTPQVAEGLGADVSQVDGAIELLAPHLTRPAVVVGKSTVPVGTAPRLAARLAELAPAGADAELVWNPEFLREGFAVADTLRPDRLVLGGATPHAEELLREVYAAALADGTPLLLTDYATAELVKSAANAFLATKISFINAIAEVCEVVGADVVDLADALGHDDRIGRKFLNAGIGFGGGCLPKDIRAFVHRAGELGVEDAVSFLRQVDDINQRRREHVVAIATAMLDGSVSGKRVGVWGAAFKPDSDDVRDSPALWIAGQLHLRGADVRVYDPEAGKTAALMFPTLTYAANPIDAATDADLLLHLTEWKEFRALDPVAVGDVVTRKQVLDGRNLLDFDAWRAAGWTVRGLGRR